MAVDAVASLDKGELGRPVVHENDVGVAMLADLERLAGPDRDHAHLNAGFLGKGRKQVAEKTGFSRSRWSMQP